MWLPLPICTVPIRAKRIYMCSRVVLIRVSCRVAPLICAYRAISPMTKTWYGTDNDAIHITRNILTHRAIQCRLRHMSCLDTSCFFANSIYASCQKKIFMTNVQCTNAKLLWAGTNLVGPLISFDSLLCYAFIKPKAPSRVVCALKKISFWVSL